MKHTEAYKKFFTKDEAGKHFIQSISSLIDTNHRKAESNPEHAHTFSQRSAGAREVVNHINTMITEPKKGATKKKTESQS